MISVTKSLGFRLDLLLHHAQAREANRVKMMIRELENPTIKSPKKPKVKKYKRNDKEGEVLREGALSSQAQITAFFGKKL